MTNEPTKLEQKNESTTNPFLPETFIFIKTEKSTVLTGLKPQILGCKSNQVTSRPSWRAPGRCFDSITKVNLLKEKMFTGKRNKFPESRKKRVRDTKENFLF